MKRAVVWVLSKRRGIGSIASLGKIYARQKSHGESDRRKESWCLFLPAFLAGTPLCSEEMTSHDTAMTSSTYSTTEDLLHFALEGLLPPAQTLVVNPATRTAMLFSQSPAQAIRLMAQQNLSPNSVRVLLPLLTAYPHYCPYDTILAHLFAVSLEDARRLLLDSWEVAIRPIRRAISTLSARLRVFGLCIRNIRGVGYLVETLTDGDLSNQKP